jgi:hypothetical protein
VAPANADSTFLTGTIGAAGNLGFTLIGDTVNHRCPNSSSGHG